MKRQTTAMLVLAILSGWFSLSLSLGAAQLKVGDKAPDFMLKTLEDRSVRLSELTTSNKVVLVVLRGWPGYQCPLCTRQVHDYVASASGFAQAKVRVVMVYPGPADNLKAHASEFLKDKKWPKDFVYLIDPNFTMINAYGLRWDAAGETAYPSTFVLNPKGVVQFAAISHSHGERTKAADMLLELKRLETN